MKTSSSHPGSKALVDPSNLGSRDLTRPSSHQDLKAVICLRAGTEAHGEHWGPPSILRRARLETVVSAYDLL